MHRDHGGDGDTAIVHTNREFPNSHFFCVVIASRRLLGVVICWGAN